MVLLMFKGSSLLCRGVVELIVVGSTHAPTLLSAFSSARPSAEQPALEPGPGWGCWTEEQLSDMKDCLG